MIPRTFHQAWIGPAERPAWADAWTARWRELHPAWELIEWRFDGTWSGTDRAWDRSGLLARASACRPQQAANIVRLELLDRFGGVWLDHDMEPLRPIDELLVGAEAAAAPFRFAPGVNNSFMAASPGHPWIRRCLALMRERDPDRPLSMGSRMVTDALGPDVVVLPRLAILQDIAWREIGKRFRPPAESRAVHHFASVEKLPWQRS
jgi:mannosyltransferase OCH1-like enzyme